MTPRAELDSHQVQALNCLAHFYTHQSLHGGP